MSRSQALVLALLLGLLAPVTSAQEVLQDERLEIRYPTGMRGAADRVLEIQPRLLAEVESRIGFRYTRRLAVWIERDQGAFNDRIVALGGSPRPDHVAAVAFPMLDLVVLKAEAWRRGSAAAFEVTYQHELVHCLLGELRRRHERMEIPVWLDEGIAQWASERGEDGREDLVAQAARRDQLIPFKKLRDDFPDQEGASALAYAQSHSLVRFIAAHDNPRGLKNNVQGMLLALAGGATVEDAIRSMTGYDFDRLEEAWRNETRASLPISTRDLPDLIFGLLILVLAALAWAVHRVRRERRLEQFDAEEAAEAEALASGSSAPPASRLDRIHDYWRDRGD
ncbi:MAG: hypothetical protein H6807_13790 [Planctomycetes bacterium]|nr:hypothetical protein [Planctomycetota bacterium]